MKNKKEIDDVRNTLLRTIEDGDPSKNSTKHNEPIYSGQAYKGGFDPDMSDFAVGFYEIIYRDALGHNRLLDEKGELLTKEFAGDTMNSFNTTAGKFLRWMACSEIERDSCSRLKSLNNSECSTEAKTLLKIFTTYTTLLPIFGFFRQESEEDRNLTLN